MKRKVWNKKEGLELHNRIGPPAQVKKGAILRFAVAAISLSMASESSRGRLLLNEAEATLQIGRVLGLNCEGKEEEVVSKLMELESMDMDKVRCGLFVVLVLMISPTVGALVVWVFSPLCHVWNGLFMGAGLCYMSWVAVRFGGCHKGLVVDLICCVESYAQLHQIVFYLWLYEWGVLVAVQICSDTAIPCIPRIPDELRAQKETAYKPRVVSIGPIHSNNERLNANEPIKLSYRDSLCSRIRGDEYMPKTMELCMSATKKLEANVKKCYAEKVELIINEKQISLAEMMLIDGCFILELLYKYYSIKNKLLKRSIDGPVFSSLMKLLAIRHDLLLLENQIPFFVLEKLFSLTVKCIPNRPHNISLTDYVLSFFGNNFSSGNDNLRKKVNTSDYHILHLLHQCYLPNHDPWKGKGDEDEIEFPKMKFRFPSTSDLDLARVKFEVGTGEDMFNVKFDKPRGLLRWFHRARFEISTLSIYDGTEPLLRNLIAFEQCCLAVPRHMTSYGFFMDTLINSAEDVKLLEKAEILHNYLGTSEEASDLFNNTCKEVVVGRFVGLKCCATLAFFSFLCF
ncbi:UPF0481 protein [Camellia lanceoleosa]|uniref:UPF0481 protein n=1 Tax=Camellia lanceoleosa TaxID=1840588 RepID=A0ACC0G9V4_9ERIC|nr:UPF0481 protein [Camellia lanceoleosa]